MKTITMGLNEADISRAIDELEAYQKSLEQKGKEICEKLGFRGAVQISTGYASTIYTGTKDYNVTVDEVTNGYAINVNGETALILEFGAGVTYGYGHPQAEDFGMGPGTYPGGKGHWSDPRGWWLPRSEGHLHTYGNPPSMAMYNAAKQMREDIESVAREVFSS